MDMLAVIFPGIGYHADKPLLYYAGRLARAAGYAVRGVPYSGFPAGVKGSAEKMEAALDVALAQAEALLADVDWEACGAPLFISKSIGTAVAAEYAARHALAPRHLLYTPLALTFRSPPQGGCVAFHGTADPWLDAPLCRQLCGRHGVPLVTVEGADHSLETGDALRDIRNLGQVMRRSQAFIAAG